MIEPFSGKSEFKILNSNNSWHGKLEKLSGLNYKLKVWHYSAMKLIQKGKFFLYLRNAFEITLFLFSANSESWVTCEVNTGC